MSTGFIDENEAAPYEADAQRAQIFGGFERFAVLIACLGLLGRGLRPRDPTH